MKMIMQRFKMHKQLGIVALCAFGTLAVALLTFVAFWLQVGFGVASFCYLLLYDPALERPTRNPLVKA
jgi:hypothetical protein